MGMTNQDDISRDEIPSLPVMIKTDHQETASIIRRTTTWTIQTCHEKGNPIDVHLGIVLALISRSYENKKDNI